MFSHLLTNLVLASYHPPACFLLPYRRYPCCILSRLSAHGSLWWCQCLNLWSQIYAEHFSVLPIGIPMGVPICECLCTFFQMHTLKVCVHLNIMAIYGRPPNCGCRIVVSARLYRLDLNSNEHIWGELTCLTSTMNYWVEVFSRI